MKSKIENAVEENSGRWRWSGDKRLKSQIENARDDGKRRGSWMRYGVIEIAD